MIIIYSEEKEKAQELVDKILQEHPEYGEITVISDLSELPQNIKINGVVDTATGMYIQDPDTRSTTNLVGDMTKRLEDVVDPKATEFLIRAFEEAHLYHVPEKLEMPDVPTYEPEHPYKQTEFQKLSSFNRKEKNQARRKLEHQALKYRNKHWKK